MMVVGQLLITPTVEICIQQLGRVEEMVWLPYAAQISQISSCSVWLVKYRVVSWVAWDGVVCAGVMHQVKKLCEPDVIDLSAKKSESAASSAGDVTVTSPADSDVFSTASSTAVTSDMAVTESSRQSCTVAPSGSSPRM